MFNTKLITILLRWIVRWYFPDLSMDTIGVIIDQYLILIQRYIKSHGVVWTIKKIKSFRLCYTRLLCGSPFKSYPSMGLDKSGFPTALSFMKDVAMNFDNRQSIRFTLTLLGLSRAMNAKVEPVYDSITLPSKAIKDPTEIIPKSFIESYCKANWISIHSLGYTDLGDIKSNFYSTKAGPMGTATSSAFEYLGNISENILGGIGSIFGDKFIEYMSRIQHGLLPKIGPSLLTPKVKPFGIVTRRLSVVNDPEAKARIIAILDYWSQVALKPLHDAIFYVLRQLPGDRTFTQSPILPREIGDNRYHSLDLSAATDRFPRVLTMSILDIIWGPNKGRAWGTVMTHEPFLAPNGDRLSYSVGQPMGAYSSWGAFTLSHHLVVQYAAHLAGFESKGPKSFHDYVLLGDDIVIYNDIVAENYLKLMTDLGVDISPMKSHVSNDTYEFAKRWFYKGNEVTGVPLRGLLENIKQPLLILSFIQNMYKKGQIPLRATNVPNLIYSLYMDLLNGNAFVRKFNKKTKKFSFHLTNRRVQSIYNSIYSTHNIQKLTVEFNSTLAREYLCRINVPGVLPPDGRSLEAMLARVSGVALADMSSETIDLLLNSAEGFKAALKEKWKSVDPIHVIDYNIYRQIPVFWGILKDILVHGNSDKLFKDMNGVAVSLAEVIVPDSSNVFSDEKRVAMTRGYSVLARGVCKYLSRDLETTLQLGRSTKLALSWSKAMADFKVLSLSPQDRIQLEIQSVQASLMM